MTTAHARRVRLMIVAGILAAGVSVCLLTSGTSSVASGAQKQPIGGVKDPLIPKDDSDIATGFLACAQCHNEKAPVDPKGNLFAKRFKSHEFVLFSEGRTWVQEDPHSAAFKALSQPLGQQMSRILKYDVTKAPQCLTCHAIDKHPGEPLPADEKATLTRFDRSEGVTCNACHGIRAPWQTEHFKDVDKGDGTRTIPWRTQSPAYKEEKGMRNLRDPVVKAELCASCHVGDPNQHRVVTHDMYAAGHPPLPPFELGTFMQCQPKHWGYPINPSLKYFTEAGFKAYAGADFAKEHPNWTWDLYRFFPADQEVYMARQLTAGAIASLQAEMKLIAADAAAVAKGEEGAVDFARFDCFACHHDLKYPSDRQARGYTGAPGRPPLKAWTAALPSVVVEHATGLKPFAETTKGFQTKWDTVQSAALARPFGKPKELAEAAKDMATWCDGFLKRDQSTASPVYTKAEAARLLALMGHAATSKQWTADPEAAMHLTWAYITLRDHDQMGNAIPDDKLMALGKIIPVRVRTPPYSDENGDPRTVGATLRQRLDVFAKYNSKDFITSFRDIVGNPPKK